MPVPLRECRCQRLGLALLMLGNIPLFDVLLLVFRTAGVLKTAGADRTYEAL